MINKLLEKIELQDLQSLVKNEVAEGKTIEFKESLPDDADKPKKKFLAEISAFANTSGGDLLYGIREENGIAKEVIGIDGSDVEGIILKYESLIRDGLEPRIQCNTHSINLNNGKIVLLFRVKKSWISPHRVIFQGHDKFYARSSAGKYPLDTMELKSAFNLSDTLIDKIEKFRIDRISALIADNTPVNFEPGAKTILHIIPLEAFRPNASVDIYQIAENTDGRKKFRPIKSHDTESSKFNFDGLVINARKSDGKSYSYVQLFRNGIIEAVDFIRIHNNGKGKISIPHRIFEESLLGALPRYLSGLQKLDVHPPLMIFLTLTGVNGYEMGLGNTCLAAKSHKIDRDVLSLEDYRETYDVEPTDILLPMFNRIWNACGHKGSPNFNERGEWTAT